MIKLKRKKLIQNKYKKKNQNKLIYKEKEKE